VANTIHTRTNTFDHLTVLSRGSKANRDREDDQQPASPTAVAFLQGTKLAHTTRNLGITATAFNTDLGALVSAICLAQDHLNRNLTQSVIIFSTNPAAIQVITNLRAGQFHA
jgi:hypothetical protein